MKYLAKIEIKHDGKLYLPGSEIELNQKQAKSIKEYIEPVKRRNEECLSECQKKAD